MKKISGCPFRVLLTILLILSFFIGFFTYAQTQSIDKIITQMETLLQKKTLEQQRRAWGNLIKKIPNLVPDSGSKTLAIYVTKKRITQKIQDINKKIKSRLEDRSHIKTEVYYILESEVGKLDPMLSDIAQVRKTMLRLINAERKKELFDTLILNDRLNVAAQKQAEYLSQTDDFYHTSKNGSTPVDRVQAQGYIFMTLGENIASGQRSVDEVMDGRMHSEGHRENIMGTGFKELGIGYMSGYRVQLFGAQFPQQ